MQCLKRIGKKKPQIRLFLTTVTFDGLKKRYGKRNGTSSNGPRLERERNEFQSEDNDNGKNEFLLKWSVLQECLFAKKGCL